MAINKKLLNEIQSVLGSSISPSLSAASAGSDLFEGYIFCLVLQAAKTEGATVCYRNVDGKTPKSFVFRTSPGYIFSQRRQYTHAVISFSGKSPLEVHIGVMVVGRSRVLHECDVAVIEQAEAETCRRRQVPPRSSKILVAMECKFYSTPLHLNLARSFIGLVSDISPKESVFVTNSSSTSVEKLLSGRNKKWEHNVIPSSTIEVSRLQYLFQDAFKNYKAT
jgi:hypothetical protein